jgi:hypothetical protein
LPIFDHVVSPMKMTIPTCIYHTWVVQTILKGRFIIGLAHYPGITWKPMHSLLQAYPDWFILASFQGRHTKKSWIYPQSHGWESVQFYFRDHFFFWGLETKNIFLCVFSNGKPPPNLPCHKPSILFWVVSSIAVLTFKVHKSTFSNLPWLS